MVALRGANRQLCALRVRLRSRKRRLRAARPGLGCAVIDNRYQLALSYAVALGHQNASQSSRRPNGNFCAGALGRNKSSFGRNERVDRA